MLIFGKSYKRQIAIAPQIIKSQGDRLSILTNSDRPSKNKPTSDRLSIPHNQRSPLKKQIKQRSPL